MPIDQFVRGNKANSPIFSTNKIFLEVAITDPQNNEDIKLINKLLSRQRHFLIVVDLSRLGNKAFSLHLKLSPYSRLYK